MRLDMRLLTAALVLNLVNALSIAGQTVGVTSLEHLRDVARPLLIFAPTPDDPRLEIQLRTLQQHPAEVHNRDLVPFGLPFHSPTPTAAQLSATDADAVRRRFHVAPGDFVIILLGKDGGAKLRVDKPLSIEHLGAAIDAMPMRKDEMRKRQGP